MSWAGPGASISAGSWSCAGPLEPHKGFMDALWAYDILRYVYADLHLLVVGTGSHRERLEWAVRRCELRRVHFLGVPSDWSAILDEAEVVWVPSRAHGG